VIDNVYFVGTERLGTFLITTPAGHILINSDLESTVPEIQRSMAALGFKLTDIKILLGSHAHGDHMQADALVKQLTGAQVMAMAEDVPALHTMKPRGKEHPIDRVLHSGERVTLGGTTLIAYRTPAHTKGCTTWGMKASEDGKKYDVLIVCSYGVNDDYVLVGNRGYPESAADYRGHVREGAHPVGRRVPLLARILLRLDREVRRAAEAAVRPTEPIRRPRRLPRARGDARAALQHDARRPAQSSPLSPAPTFGHERRLCFASFPSVSPRNKTWPTRKSLQY
jgi:hypothetical protein